MSWWRTGTLAVAGTIPVRSVTAPAILVRSEGHHPAGNWTAIPIRVYESGSGAAAAARAVPVRHPCRPRSPPRGRGGLDKGTLAMAPDQAERAGQKAARSATAAYGPSPLVKSGAPATTTSRGGVPGPSPAGHGSVRRNRPRKPPQTKSEQGMNPVQAVQKLDRPLHMRSEAPLNRQGRSAHSCRIECAACAHIYIRRLAYYNGAWLPVGLTVGAKASRCLI
jgi:hypothetical protein